MEDKKLRELAARLKMLSATAIKSARHDLETRLRNDHIGVSPLSLMVLKMIKKESCTIGELSKKLMMAPASLVPVIDSLANKGFVKRGIDSSDRRRNPLTLTAKGDSLLGKVQSIYKDDIIVKSLSKLGEKKASQLVSLLEDLTSALSGGKNLCDDEPYTCGGIGK